MNAKPVRMEESPIRLSIKKYFWKKLNNSKNFSASDSLGTSEDLPPCCIRAHANRVGWQGFQHICICATAMCVWSTCSEGWTSAGQQCERTRQISQRLKALLPSGGYGQALKLMWTNKGEPEWVEWTIICAGEALSWNGACLFSFQSGQWRGIVEDGVKKKSQSRQCMRERTHNPIDFLPNTAVFYMCVSVCVQKTNVIPT